MSRYWGAASDLDAYPPQDDGYWPEMERALDEDRAKLEALESGEFWRSALEQEGMPPPRESARRRKLFARAEGALSVMVALRGAQMPPITVTAWYGRHGRRLGLFSYYDADNEIRWTPRRGFEVVELDDIPF